VLGAGTLIVSTAGTREPWEFVGLGDVERLASLVEGVAEERGGLALAEADDDWGAWPSEAEDADGPEALEGGSDDDLVDDDLEDEDEDDEEPAEEAAPVRRGRWRRRAARTSR